MIGTTEESSSRSRPGDGAKSGQGAAFFDLDGTLVAGQTTLLLVKFLRKRRVVTRLFVLGTALWFLGYKVGVLRVTEKSRHQGARVFVDLTVQEVDELMEQFSAEVLAPRFEPAAVEALEEHRVAGDHIAVISAALVPVVKAVCRRLDIRDYTGTECEVQEGRYRGRLLGPSPHGDEKREVAAEYMKRWGVDAAECWAYADHGSDLGLLRSVGHPVAVNPKPELLAAAREADWPVLARGQTTETTGEESG